MDLLFRKGGSSAPREPPWLRACQWNATIKFFGQGILTAVTDRSTGVTRVPPPCDMPLASDYTLAGNYPSQVSPTRKFDA